MADDKFPPLDAAELDVTRQAVHAYSRVVGAWCKSTRFRYYPEHNTSLPGHIELHVVGPDRQTTRLAVALHSHNINRLYVDPGLTWQMPRPADVPQIDLSTVDPSSLQSSRSGSGSSLVETATPRPWQFDKLRGFDLR